MHHSHLTFWGLSMERTIWTTCLWWKSGRPATPERHLRTLVTADVGKIWKIEIGDLWTDGKRVSQFSRKLETITRGGVVADDGAGGIFGRSLT